jgi:hypothetical protein
MRFPAKRGRLGVRGFAPYRELRACARLRDAQRSAVCEDKRQKRGRIEGWGQSMPAPFFLPSCYRARRTKRMPLEIGSAAKQHAGNQYGRINKCQLRVTAPAFVSRWL